jgi:hypothetical protein
VAQPVRAAFKRLFTTSYKPNPEDRDFAKRAQTQSGPQAAVTVAVLDAPESEQYFGVPMARRGLQPVLLKIENHSQALLRLQLLRIDPNYYTPLEAAGVNHFSLVKRLSAFGLVAWLFLPLLLPLLIVMPSKLITAWFANRRMDAFFREQAFRLRPIPPGGTSEGFVFTSLDAGTKVVRVSLQMTSPSAHLRPEHVEALEPAESAIEFSFSISVPGISADYLRRDFQTLETPGSLVECDVPTLVERLEAMPPATANRQDNRLGDPLNLVVVGDFATLLAAFAARWDESETITIATCWKTMRAFLLGSHYRYSPVSALHLFGRSQDVALQRARHSINERLHLRLWLTQLRFQGQPVWLGQVSRDIGVRFTTKTWNLTTHRIDPDVDEARDYVVEDLLQAEHLQAAGYVEGVGECSATAPRHNLTGDPYHTDGRRAVVLLSGTRTTPKFIAWS